MIEFIWFSLNSVVEKRVFKIFLSDEKVRSLYGGKNFLDCSLIRLLYWGGPALLTWTDLSGL